MSGLELKNTKNKTKEQPPNFPNTSEGATKGKLEIGKLIDKIPFLSYTTAKDISNLTRIESDYGSHKNTNKGDNKGPMQIHVSVMSKDILIRPRYYGLVVSKSGLIDEAKSSPISINLIQQALGVSSSIDQQPLKNIVSYLSGHVTTVQTNIAFGSLILYAFNRDNKVRTNKIPTLSVMFNSVKSQLISKGVVVNQASFDDLVRRIRNNDDNLGYRFNILKRYNASSLMISYALKILYCSEYM